MKETDGNKVDHGGIPESCEDEMEDLVRSTQQNLADWKTRTKRKRFRFQNIQGTILTLCHLLISSRLISALIKRLKP